MFPNSPSQNENFENVGNVNESFNKTCRSIHIPRIYFEEDIDVNNCLLCKFLPNKVE